MLREEVSFNILRPTKNLVGVGLVTIKATHKSTGITATVIHQSETFGKQIALTELERKLNNRPGNGQ